MPRNESARELLAAFGDELRFLLIVSEATVVHEGEAPEVNVRVAFGRDTDPGLSIGWICVLVQRIWLICCKYIHQIDHTLYTEYLNRSADRGDVVTQFE